MSTKTIIGLLAGVAVMAVSAASYGQASPEGPDGGTWRAKRVALLDTGLNVPECALPERGGERVFVSNIVTDDEGYWSNDGNGFVCVMDAKGAVIQKRFVESTVASPVHAPKGMAILEGYLFFTDNENLRQVLLTDPGTIKTIALPGAQRLNDAYADGKEVFVSDTATGNIFAVKPDGTHRILAGPQNVNGVTCHQDVLYAVSWDPAEVYELDPAGKKPPVPFGVKGQFKNLDGIAVLDDGSFLVSDFTGNRVAVIAPDRQTVTTLIELESPAEFGLDTERGLIYIPLFMQNQVAVYRLFKE